MNEPLSANPADQQPSAETTEPISAAEIVAPFSPPPVATTAVRRTKWWRIGPVGVTVLAIIGLVAWMFTSGVVMPAREAARRTHCKCTLKQFGPALHNYHDVYGSFPPAFVRGPDGRPWHSWRVLILPYLDQAPLYKQYNFAEPWDGPNNRKLVEKMPLTFDCPSRPPCVVSAGVASIPRGLLACAGSTFPTAGFTSYAAVLGPNCVFRGVQPSTLKDIVDGTSNTLLVGECARTKIPWTKPEDIDITFHPKIGDPDGFSSFHKGGAQFLLGDGTVRMVNLTAPQQIIDALYSRNGGETIPDF